MSTEGEVQGLGGGEKEVLDGQEKAEREAAESEENGGGSDGTDPREEASAGGDSFSGGEEREREVGPSAVETAAPTDAVRPESNPTQHHPLVRSTASQLSLVFEKRPSLSPFTSPQSLSWCFSFNHSLPVHNVSTDSRRVSPLYVSSLPHSLCVCVLFQMVFCASSHTGVLYDCESNQQCLLQGHVSLCNL